MKKKSSSIIELKNNLLIIKVSTLQKAISTRDFIEP